MQPTHLQKMLRFTLLTMSLTCLATLMGCGVSPRRIISCKAYAPQDKAGTIKYYILDGFKMKHLGGLNVDAEGSSYYVSQDASDEHKDWEKITIDRGIIKTNPPSSGSEMITGHLEWSDDTRLLAIKYIVPKGEPTLPDLLFRCEETNDKPEQIVSMIKHQEELQLQAKADREAEKNREKQIADGTYQPGEFEVGRTCKELAKENTFTKEIDWGFLGGANSKWFPNLKTIILEGKTKNAFGVNIPFSIECRWERGGIVRVVEIR